MVDIPGLAGFQNQSHAGAFFRFDKMLVQCGYGQQGRNCHMVFVHPSVGEDQNVGAFPVYPVRFHKQTLNRPLQLRIFIIGNGNNRRFEAVFLHTFYFHQIRIGQNRIIYF